MRQKRAKVYRKLMSLYSLSFGFRQPYQVLLDSEMCRLAAAAKIDLQHQLSIVLQGNVKPMITQCCIQELYLQGKSQQPAVDVAKSFERRKCNHREAILGEECITSVVGKPFTSSVDAWYLDVSLGDSNKHRYVIATQSQTLRVKLWLIPAVPIVRINRAVMILEPPSDVTLKVKQENEERAFQPSAAELAALKADSIVEPRHRKRVPKGPNPLSMKKKAVHNATLRIGDPVARQKRKSTEIEDTTTPAVRKRRRRRKHQTISETLNDTP